MSHCDPDDLTLLALGEDVDVDEEHLAACPDCQAEVEALRSVVAAGRSGDVAQVPPPPRVWEGIAAATGVTAVPRSMPAVTGATAAPQADSPGEVTPLPTRRERTAGRWPTWALAAATVAGFALGGGLVAGVVTMADEPPASDPTPVFATDLEPLVETADAGSAELVDADEGLVLRLSASGLPEDEDGFYEVWLLDEQAQRMVPLGVMRPGGGDFVVPDGLDLGEFPVVDVSVEPFDGDPTHSGNSLLRGVLDT